MKKSIFVLALTIGATAASAQLVLKKGEPILPQTGDWGLGIEANSFLNYLGNFFGKSAANTAPSYNFVGNQVIVGKYFVDSVTAYRGGLRLGFNNVSTHQMVSQLPAA